MLLAEITQAVGPADLVASYDMLGLPMPPWLAQALMALTLALHWAFLSMTAGGAVAYLFPPASSPAGAVRGKLAVFLPFSLATAMTLGIAPLLFVQVLYGQFFYSANILMGYVWLGLLGLMIVNLYLLYCGWRRVRSGRPVRGVGVGVVVLLAASAMILSANATLTQRPDAWRAFAARGGVAPYLGDATFWPRWLMALCGLLAGGGLFVAAFLRALGGPGPAGRAGDGRALGVALAGVVGMVAFGVRGATVAPPRVAEALQAGPEAPFAWAAGAALVATAVLTVAAMRRETTAAVVLPGATFLVALLALAAARDTARRAALGAYFDLPAVPVHAQWSSFIAFAAVFVAGLGLMAYMVKIAFCGPAAPSDAGAAR